jgi:bacillolysin
MMKNYPKLLALILLSFNVLISKAQQNDTLEIQRNDKGIVNFVRFKPNSGRKMQNDTTLLKSLLQAKNEDGFRCISESKDELDITHKKFQQYYRGIKVENAEYLTHGKNGIIETLNGNFEQVSIPSVVPSINEQFAKSKALDFVNAKKYKWEDLKRSKKFTN